jgi:hypothetical protein
MEETDPQGAAEEGLQGYDSSSVAPADKVAKSSEDQQHRDPFQSLDVMDEQRIEPSKDLSINAADVLCGRGKISFNHGKPIRNYLKFMHLKEIASISLFVLYATIFSGE